MAIKKKVKKRISFNKTGIIYEGRTLRECQTAAYLDSADVIIADQNGKIVKNADKFNEMYQDFRDKYPLNPTILKIICGEKENEFKLSVRRRLPKVHNCYRLVFFYSEAQYISSLESLNKEIREIEANPSLPLPDGDMTVDETKIKAVQERIIDLKKNHQQSLIDNPDLEFLLFTTKSEYKDETTVITFTMYADDVHKVIKQKIERINHNYNLFLTAKS